MYNMTRTGEFFAKEDGEELVGCATCYYKPRT